MPVYVVLSRPGAAALGARVITHAGRLQSSARSPRPAGRTRPGRVGSVVEVAPSRRWRVGTPCRGDL